MNYQKFNQYVDAYKASSDVCTQKLWERRQEGSNIAMLDLRLAYLHINVDKSLCPFQKIGMKGKRYCLTR